MRVWLFCVWFILALCVCVDVCVGVRAVWLAVVGVCLGWWLRLVAVALCVCMGVDVFFSVWWLGTMPVFVVLCGTHHGC